MEHAERNPGNYPATEEISKYSYGLKLMAGGVTVSGGEPLLQRQFVAKLFKAAQAMGIHTTLDTNGYFGERISDQDLEAIDLVMLCIKMWDPEGHVRLTGVDGSASRAFARRLATLGRPMWVRIVLVPGLTDEPEDIAHIAYFAAELGNVDRAQVLPFHQMGRYMWHALGMNYSLEDVEPPSVEVEKVCEQFRKLGLNAH